MGFAKNAAGWIALALLVSTTPAAAIAYDAQNAHRVDGKHAVGAGASKAARAGKLVATNSKGFLPNNIIKIAPNSAKLGGKPRSFFAPANHTHEGVPYAHVLVVAQSGGDFTSVQAALDSVVGDSGNPILIWIAPGEYDGHITMEPYVDLQGAGRNLTTLTVRGTGPAEVVEAAASSTISDLSIFNSRPESANTGVKADHIGTSVFRNVSVKPETQGLNHAIGFEVSGEQTEVQLQDSFVEARTGGDGHALGVRVSANGFWEMADSEVEAIGFGNGLIRGIDNVSGGVIVHDSSVVAVGAPDNNGGTVGIATGSDASGASTTIRDSRIRSGATAEDDRTILIKGGGSQVHVVGSSLFNASDEAVIQSTPTPGATTVIRIVTTQLAGGSNQLDPPAPIITCLYSYDEAYEPLGTDCFPAP